MKKILCLILLISMPAFGYANERESKIETLMKAQGLFTVFKDQIRIGEAQGKQMGIQIMQQLMAKINPNDQFKLKFKSAYDLLMKKLKAPWGERDTIRVWTDKYGKHFSDDELDQLITFYTSPLGKKEVASSKSALVEFTKHFQKLGQPVFKRALEEYIKEIKIVAKECNCIKTQ